MPQVKIAPGKKQNGGTVRACGRDCPPFSVNFVTFGHRAGRIVSVQALLRRRTGVLRIDTDAVRLSPRAQGIGVVVLAAVVRTDVMKRLRAMSAPVPLACGVCLGCRQTGREIRQSFDSVATIPRKAGD